MIIFLHQLSRNTLKFLVVRHPLERLLSCYRDKYEGAKKSYYYQLYGEKMVRMFRPKPEGFTSIEVMFRPKPEGFTSIEVIVSSAY